MKFDGSIDIFILKRSNGMIFLGRGVEGIFKKRRILYINKDKFIS